MFVYHVIVVTYSTSTIKWKVEELNIFNTFGSLVAFVAFYDYFYMWFHYFLHVRWLYPWIHKHHHRQKAPSRGNLDAINVHPLEYITGEYLHLLTIYIIPCHVYTVGLFILMGGVLASLNHTRFDIVLPFGLYDVKAHDVHHRIPESNYAQYTMYWDKLHGFYRPYEGKEKDEKAN
jgi:sterol desaturase/sphingolipid hydroxylase (fatty acid hydroxylase superfamily)